MGTIARPGLWGVFIGNTAENIINTLECPVLAVSRMALSARWTHGLQGRLNPRNRRMPCQAR
ncbi:hypothetical protein [Yoonia sp.]|uniref:hypothetical protein n=1 Tax=Yoonia sp. TaxID=2212373 RepID=UPI0039C8FA9B